MCKKSPNDVRFEVAAASDIGRRDKNEDRFAVCDLGEGRWFVAVFDGLGGQAAGEVASEMAMQLLQERARRWTRRLTQEALADDLDAQLKQTHDRIRARAKKDRNLQGMATTVNCAVLRPDGIVQRYAGDSALFWTREDRLLYRSAPHVIDDKIYSCLGGPGPLRVSPQRSQEYDWRLTVRPGDTLVLCTDGLLHSLAERTLLTHFADPGSAEELAQRLVRAAVRAGEQDNITVVTVRVLEPSA